MYIKRTNYQSLIWYQTDQVVQCIPQLNGHGWDTYHEKLEFKWTEGDRSPQEHVEVLLEEPEPIPEERPQLVKTILYLIQIIELMSFFLQI